MLKTCELHTWARIHVLMSACAKTPHAYMCVCTYLYKTFLVCVYIYKMTDAKSKIFYVGEGFCYLYFFQVQIAISLYLQVYKKSYVYLQVQSLHTSTHSYFFILAITKNKLCILGQFYKYTKQAMYTRTIFSVFPLLYLIVQPGRCLSWTLK